MVFTYDKVAAALINAGVPKQLVECLDEDMYCPPLEAGMSWVQNKLAASLQNLLFSQGWKYAFERFDCDNFSLLAVAIAQMCWEDTEGAPEAGLAFGLFGFATQGHCITVGVFNNNGTLVVKFFEPQPSVRGSSALALTCLNEVQLTREDTASCVACWFC